MTGRAVPVKLEVCGLPGALSTMESKAVDVYVERLPVGLNSTFTAQFAPAAKLAPHVFVCTKSYILLPWKPMLDMLNRALPVLESVTACAGVVKPPFSWPNERFVGERVTKGMGTTDPVKPAPCGLSLALSVITSEALRDPVAVGVKVTLIAQLAADKRLVPQLFVCAKSVGFAPPSAMLEMFSVAVPAL